MTQLSGNISVTVGNILSALEPVITAIINLISLGSLATTFQTIANALTSMGGFTMPQIAAGTVAPYQTRVAATAAPAEDSDGVTAYLLGILSELQALARSMRNGDGSSEQVIHIEISGRELFDVIVKENKSAIKCTGRSPLITR